MHHTQSQEVLSLQEKRLKWLFWSLVVITALISIVFIYFCFSRFVILGSRNISWSVTGQVGDFVGGVIGTLASLLGFILVYLSLESQKRLNIKLDKQFEKSQIESRFIELIKLHKENLYDIYIERNDKEIKRRKAIDFIVDQIKDCYKEIIPFFIDVDAEEVYTPAYLAKTVELVNERKSIDLIGLSHIDIAYSIVFFGTSHEDIQSLSKLLSECYKEAFIRKIVLFIRLKPLDVKKLHQWNVIIKSNLTSNIITEIIEKYNRGEQITSLNDFDPDYIESFSKLLPTSQGFKYYGGHQYKLGQYFRHLFQTVKYINEKEILKKEEKYNYIKTLRAQLSTIEQYLLFYNSISFMGRPWELSFVKK